MKAGPKRNALRSIREAIPKKMRAIVPLDLLQRMPLIVSGAASHEGRRSICSIPDRRKCQASRSFAAITIQSFHGRRFQNDVAIKARASVDWRGNSLRGATSFSLSPHGPQLLPGAGPGPGAGPRPAPVPRPAPRPAGVAIGGSSAGGGGAATPPCGTSRPAIQVMAFSRKRR